MRSRFLLVGLLLALPLLLACTTENAGPTEFSDTVSATDVSNDATQAEAYALHPASITDQMPYDNQALGVEFSTSSPGQSEGLTSMIETGPGDAGHPQIQERWQGNGQNALISYEPDGPALDAYPLRE